jgi:hypothetical protein
MTRPPVVFGRRGALGAPATASQSPSSPAERTSSEQATQLRSVIVKMLVLIPATICVTVLFALMVKHDSSAPNASSETAGTSNGRECRAKATAGSVFDIDWCEAGAAALQGAARGVAAGSARAR